MKEIIVNENHNDQRIDRVLKNYFGYKNKSFVYKMIRKKNIVVNGKKVKEDYRLKIGDVIKIFVKDETIDFVKKNVKTIDYDKLNVDIDIIYEDDNIMILNKPVGILSQKADNELSINEMTLAYLKKNNYKFVDGFTPSIVNRLDRDTSGLIIFSKTLESSRQFSIEKNFRKHYYAIVIGKIVNNKIVENSIYIDENGNVKVDKDNSLNSLKCITKINPIKVFEYEGTTLSLLDVEILTGRKHQIRITLSDMGFPILGDCKYGSRKINKKLKQKNQFLMAYKYEFCNEYILKDYFINNSINENKQIIEIDIEDRFKRVIDGNF